MLLIWGFRTIFRTIAEGDFFCPTCGGDRTFQRREARRWFTLFFIPLIPMQKRGEVIRCTTCGTNFNESVLSRPTSAVFGARLQDAARGVVVQVLRSGLITSADARAVAIAQVLRAGVQGYDDAALTADLDTVPSDLSTLLGSVSEQLAEQGRESLLTAAVTVALAEGPLPAARQQVVETIGRQLGMTAAHVAGVVAVVSQRSTREG
jgi:hypothetical protein